MGSRQICAITLQTGVFAVSFRCRDEAGAGLDPLLIYTLDFAHLRKYSFRVKRGKEGEMVKRLNCHLTDELHRKLRIALAEREITFSDWVREHIEQFVTEAERKRTRGAKGMKKGKGA